MVVKRFVSIDTVRLSLFDVILQIGFRCVSVCNLHKLRGKVDKQKIIEKFAIDDWSLHYAYRLCKR